MYSNLLVVVSCKVVDNANSYNGIMIMIIGTVNVDNGSHLLFTVSSDKR